MNLYLGDCLEVLPTLPDNSVDAIVTDPPYFKVKKEAWDRNWEKPELFISWLESVSEEWYRILKPNGSIYCFASPRMAARVEVMLGKRFNVLNRITWQKPLFSTKAEMFRKSDLRTFFPASEAIIFCEHKGADGIAKGELGYGAKCDELRGFVFEPLQSWFRDKINLGALDHKAINQVIGTSTSGGGMASHYFGKTCQYTLPTLNMYQKMRAAWPHLFDREYEDLKQEYEALRKEYENLRREYETFRRPFSVTQSVPYTDVWSFPTVKHYPGKHPCEKPLAMMEHIISVSTRPDAVVLDCFMGHGTTGKAALSLGRDFIGVEKDPDYFEVAKSRIENTQAAA